ncbi:bifunctional nuclease family protein [Algoriphagus halophytocola]|uniref:Bifunctional nuclease family protein n=1 Tax=Algoriphagus halophytocola TaxID=2991499 RepID=A0ABY6MIG6_9BACT|nr:MULTISPECIES: bifunctional nuclease family protein [unclassified Algoriphagus]UZD23588.1 bifunctional nuclease family protein [Algoriphagus sp. TR-M5]WBL44881.1 bifunctional nuclease family protein [Algoriphagus sp. TR-M9]
MEKLIELEILGLSSNHSQSGSFTLVLGEVGGVRRLPIVIGMFEAQAIALEIEKIVPNRPMTHDLFRSFATGFNYEIEKIVITDMQEGVFYAKIHCKSSLAEVEVDARPSDAIAIAIRFGSPVYCTEKAMSEGAVEHFEVESKDEKEPPKKPAQKFTTKKEASLKDFSLDKLNQMLDKAIANEDYERAARIRDEINKRN